MTTHIVDSSNLPTHIALVARRLAVTGLEESADSFLMTSYLAEAAIKSVAIALHTGLRQNAREVAYRMAYELLRADGLGSWEKAIREAVTPPVAGYFPPEFHGLLAWATQRRTKPGDAWFVSARDSAKTVLSLLGQEPGASDYVLTVKDLISLLVQIRNKTKAHGAVGPDFYAKANVHYAAAVRDFVITCPAFSWSWLHLSTRTKGEPVRAIQLRGTTPVHVSKERAGRLQPTEDGIYLLPDAAPAPLPIGVLLSSNRECSDFLLPNGGLNDKGSAEFIDYANGKTANRPVDEFVRPPAPLPESETHGATTLDVQSNVFGNLPELARGYVERPKLQQELVAKLTDRNHPIITLHGAGGVGKTSLALFIAHRLAKAERPPFDAIVWFSARDIDLRLGGPKPVRQDVTDLRSISLVYGRLFGAATSVEGFAEVLQKSQDGAGSGSLFIFDNFETLSSVREIHQFLDTHTHIPNKVLITSRERAFKADYPIEVMGMELPEAEKMLHLAARELEIEGLLTDKVIRDIFDYAKGHAYVMRVLIGEMAKERQYVSPPQVLSQRDDIVNAVFERSFNKLSADGRTVFLIVTGWRSPVSELALVVVLAQRGVDVESGIAECEQLSLIASDESATEVRYCSAPPLARLFGARKLQGDPDRLVIRSDLDTIQHFGVIPSQSAEPQSYEEQIQRFVQWCMDQALDHDKFHRARVDRSLQALAVRWAEGWLVLAQFRIATQAPQAEVEYALRRSVEETPYSKAAWLARAEYAAGVGDEAVRIASLVSAVEADPADTELMREVAFQLCSYVTDKRAHIPIARRGVYLASVRDHLRRVANKLDATGLSRLAWLYLLENDSENARRYASQGLKKEPSNEHCRRIIARLSQPPE